MKGREKTLKNLTFFLLSICLLFIYDVFSFFFFIFIIHQAVFLKRGEINEMEESIILWRDFLRCSIGGKKKTTTFLLTLIGCGYKLYACCLVYVKILFKHMWIENERVYIDDGMNYVFQGACLMVHRIFLIFLP